MNHRPADLHITPRKVHYDYSESMKRSRYWHGGDPVWSHLINALQATFPEGERFFMDAARDSAKLLAERGGLDKQLDDDLAGFNQQEAMHGQQHREWTEALIEAGYDRMEHYDEQERAIRLWFDKHVSARMRLSITAACEHYTASLAYYMACVRPELITASAPPFRELLLYHAMEELEHKSVCFDLYQQLSGSYLVRIFGFIFGTIDLVFHVATRQRYLMKADGLWDRAHRRAMRKLVWSRSGIVRAMWPRIRAYLSPSFHPWQTDERAKLEEMFGQLRAEAGIAPFQYGH